MRPLDPLRIFGAAALGLAAMVVTSDRAAAQGGAYLGQIFPVAFTFCPRGTTSAEGQLLSISENQSLYSLYGTTYGGDGRTTFALPDLRGRTPIDDGTGPGLQPRQLGSTGGALEQILSESQMPAHTHAVRANNLDGDKPGPGNKLLAAAPTGGTGNETIYSTEGPTVTMSSQMIAATGGGAGGTAPIVTEDPTIVIRYCVALQGQFPSRN